MPPGCNYINNKYHPNLLNIRVLQKILRKSIQATLFSTYIAGCGDARNNPYESDQSFLPPTEDSGLLDAQLQEIVVDAIIDTSLPPSYWDSSLISIDAGVNDSQTSITLPTPCSTEEKDITSCFLEDEEENCLEVKQCDGEYWIECHPKGREECNGLDDNCNLLVDEVNSNEIAPVFSPFYDSNNPHQPERLYKNCGTKIGACEEGRQYCGEFPGKIFAFSRECYGVIFPGYEICNNLDDDCNGIIDDINDLGDSCTTREDLIGPLDIEGGINNLCRPGVWGCNYETQQIECVGETLPKEERCNELDDDCDGIVDEDAGDCVCGNPIYDPHPETCNGLDDDCDGFIDNSVLNNPLPLSIGCYIDNFGVSHIVNDPNQYPDYIIQGICHPGLMICINGETSGECLGTQMPMATDTCNGVDDDCNGEIDENIPRSPADVLIIQDISGSMSPLEQMMSLDAFLLATTSMNENGQDNNLRYFAGAIGVELEHEPVIIEPSQDGLPGVGIPEQDIQSTLENFYRNLPENNGEEYALDLLEDFFSQDRLPAEINFTFYDPLTLGYGQGQLNLQEGNRRIAIIITDELAQSGRINQPEDVAALMQPGDAVYVIAPDIRVIAESYEAFAPKDENGYCQRFTPNGHCINFYATPDNIENAEAIAERIEEVFEILSCATNPEEPEE